jgi:CheY-like chemotaxis protein
VGRVTIKTENVTFDELYCAANPESSPGEYVMLGVSDDGRGMDKEVVDRLFEPFFTTKPLGKGTGLGLSTVYGIVKQNEGFINVYSEPGMGSTFKIYLRRHEGKEAEDVIEEKVPEIPRGRGETLLMVEDEGAILNVGHAMLESLGYKVLTAATPSEAIQLAQSHADRIQLLITDVVMPEMNGRDLATLLCDANPKLKCLFASGYSTDVIAHQGVLEEGVHFLEKPFSLPNLASKVREVLDQA